MQHLFIQQLVNYLHSALEEYITHRLDNNLPVNRVDLSPIINKFVQDLSPPVPITIVCDMTNNTEEDLGAGKLHVDIIGDPNNALMQRIAEACKK
jgi:hypothetical protein